jgi:tetratricopeptide (TPR) repeat protein
LGIHAEVLQTIGTAYRNLGMYSDAERTLSQALKLRESDAPNDQLALAACKQDLALLYHQRRRCDRRDNEEALRLYDEVLKLHPNQTNFDKLLVSQTVFLKAWLLTQMEDFAAAEKLFHQVIEVRRSLLGDNDRGVLVAEMGLVGIESEKGNFAGSMNAAKNTISKLVALEKDKRLSRMVDRFNQGVTSHSLGKFLEAKRSLEKCLDLIKQPGNEEHFYLTIVLPFLAGTLERLEDHCGTEECYKGALKIAKAKVGLEHPLISGLVVPGFARYLHRRGQNSKAESILNEALVDRIKRFGANDYQVANTMMVYADIHEEWGDYRKQQELAQKAQKIFDATGGPKRRLYPACCASRARACLRSNDAPGAIALSETALRLMSEERGYRPVDVARAKTCLAAALLEQGKSERVEELLQDSMKIYNNARLSSWLRKTLLPGGFPLLAEPLAGVHLGSEQDTVAQLNRLARIKARNSKPAAATLPHRE